MNWWGFTFTVGMITLILFATALSIYDSSDSKEIPCYDNHNNVIHGVTCENKMILSESSKLWGEIFIVLGWFVMLFFNILVWREQ